MSSPNVPDPYAALGVATDATTQQIKVTYRKLALKFHPDKVQDESLKAAASENFHKIQQAYEILGDEERRGRYDASVRLAQLRKEVIEKQQQGQPQFRTSRTDIRTAAFGVPTQTPGRASYTARGPERTRDDKRSKTYDDYDYFAPRPASRKTSDYEREREREPRKYSFKPEPEKPRERDYARETREREKENERAYRAEKKKATDKDRRKERQDRRYSVPDDSDSDDLSEFKRFSSRRAPEDKDYSRRQNSSSHYDDDDYERNIIDAKQHIEAKRSRAEALRPSMNRSSSEREPLVRPSATNVRRSSARPVSSGHDRRNSEKDRKYSAGDAEYAEPLSSHRPPGLQKNYSSPADIRIPQSSSRSDPRRAQTSNYDSRRDVPDFEAPTLRRSETAPIQSSNRRKESSTYTSSKLRHTEVNDGLPTPSTTPDHSPDDEYSRSPYLTSNGRRTAYYEPQDRLRRSPSPPINERSSDRRSPRDISSRIPPLAPLRTHSSSYGAPRTESPVEMQSPSSRHYGEGTTPPRKVSQYTYPLTSPLVETRSRDRGVDRERDRDRDRDRDPTRDRERERERERERDRDPRRERDRGDRDRESPRERPRYSSIDPDDTVPVQPSFKIATGGRSSSSRKMEPPGLLRRMTGY